MRSAGLARVLLFSDRELAPAVSRCGTYEFEDVACAIDAVDLAPMSEPAGRVLRRVERALPRAFASPAGLRRNPPYDLLYVSVHTLPDLARLHPLGAKLRLARCSAINIDEVWKHQLHTHSGDLRMLSRFDRVFTACAGGADALAEAIGRPVEYLPPSVDALRFAPPASAPQRVVDVHFMGRRRRDLHEAIREAAAKSERYYSFDTIQLNPRVSDYVEHRNRLADLIQRTGFFVADIANSDVPEKRGDQEEFGPRYVEGLAGGAILIGRAPATEAFRSRFWPEAVIPVEPDADAIARALDELESEPSRLEATRHRNVARMLRAHDSVYRWEQILRAVGLGPMPAVEKRKQMLERVATEFEGRAA